MQTFTMILRPKHIDAPGWKPGDPIPPGYVPESFHCIDCGVDTGPGQLARGELELAYAAAVLRGEDCRAEVTYDSRTEIYCVRGRVWKASGMKAWGGCLCIGCLEKRLGRRLGPRDFEPGHPFNDLPGTPRLMERRQGRQTWQAPAGQWEDWAAAPA